MNIYCTKLNVGDLYYENRGGLKSYRKITKIGTEISKIAGGSNPKVYYYIKCDKNGVEKAGQSGICYAEKVDQLLVSQEAELVLA